MSLNLQLLKGYYWKYDDDGKDYNDDDGDRDDDDGDDDDRDDDDLQCIHNHRWWIRWLSWCLYYM